MLLQARIAAGNVSGVIQSTSSVTCTPAPTLDSDGDGVTDDQDVCPATVIPEAVPTQRLGINRFALLDGDMIFNTAGPNGKGPQKIFTVEDTAGCSRAQIIDALSLGNGHTKFGCSISAMEEWSNFVNP